MTTIALFDFLVALDLLIVFISFGIAVLLDYSLPQCKGKEKAPTHAFQVIVSYAKKVLPVSNVHFGCDNDKTRARFNAAITNLINLANIWRNSFWEDYYLQTRWNFWN